MIILCMFFRCEYVISSKGTSIENQKYFNYETQFIVNIDCYFVFRV